VLHASWVPPLGLGDHALALWAEVESEAPARRGHSHADARDDGRVRAHPFAARSSELVSALERLWKIARPGIRPRTGSKPARQPIWLPSMGTRPQPSPELVRVGWARDPALDGFEPARAMLVLWRVEALLLDPDSAGTLLAGLPHHSSAELHEPGAETPARGAVRLVAGSDLRFWCAAAKLVLDLLARQRYLPGAREGLESDYSGFFGPSANLVGQWYASLSDPADRVRFDALTEAMPEICRAAVNAAATDATIHGAIDARTLLEDFTHTVVNARVMRWLSQDRWLLLPAGGRQDPYNRYGAFPLGVGYGGGIGSLTERWLAGLSAPDRPIYTTPVEADNLLDGIDHWHADLTGMLAAPVRLCLRLVPPAGPHGEDAAPTTDAAPEDALPAPPRLVVAGPGDDVEAPATAPTELFEATLEGDEPWQLQYWLQARDDPSLLAPLADLWRQPDEAPPLDPRFAHAHEHALLGLSQAARLFTPIQRGLQSAAPVACALSPDETYTFLREGAPLLEEAGFAVQVPAWWRRVAPRPNLRLRLRGARKTTSGLMGLGAVVGYDWKLALGDQEFNQEELERLVALKTPLVRVRGQWMELRPEQVDAALKFVRAHPSGRMSIGEALRASLTGEVGDGSVEVDEVRADEWIGDLFTRLRAGEALAEVPPPRALQGTLRPYQVRGLGWLAFLARFGLGACLADDMGLGKTVELLSLLLHQKEAATLEKPVLLVCPTSVVGNWRHETARFAPSLRLLVHHGAARIGRAAAEQFAREVAGYDLVVTTYSLLPRDAATLATAEWGAVVLDEAQNIKNVEAKQSRIARDIRAPVRIALTGTPVENRLAELWSIMDFLNPGYLGSHKRFAEHFAGPIERERDRAATARLQALVRPFVLRRLKTDPTVISDLPRKLEIKEYCTLTREQVTLYEAVVRDGLRQIDEADGMMRRRAIVLTLLSKLKQVCNHPAHFLGDGSDLAGRSGKLTRLEELIEELLSEGDRALIFTQFTAMGDRLEPYLQERFGVEALYLHGGVPQQRRERLVARFQAEDGPPLFLLSLKAGGTGLNLTRATHVIHFDRWWNPAVENQATDRAFRIGQTRNVQVRKFVCSGTLEERIDAMIEQKRELAETVIGAGEGWITEMSTDQLRDLFTLRADALGE
jgi:SNF2 family DNA or RNA helicase